MPGVLWKSFTLSISSFLSNDWHLERPSRSSYRRQTQKSALYSNGSLVHNIKQYERTTGRFRR